MSVKTAANLISDLLSCYGKGNTYGTPEVINLKKLQAGKQKVMCAGFIKAALPSMYNGTNTVWRTQLAEKGSISDHKSDNKYPKNVNPLKSSQLQLGMAVFKWNSVTPSKFKDKLGDYQHMGVVISVKPLKIIHCSSVSNGITIDTKIGKWCAWGKFKPNMVIYDEKGKDEPPNEQIGGKDMLYQSMVKGGLLNVRKTASKNADVVTKLKTGSIVDVYEEQGDWLRIQYGASLGWVMKKYTAKVPGTEADNQVTEEELPFTDPEDEQKTEYITLEVFEAYKEKMEEELNYLKEQFANFIADYELTRGD